MRIRRNSLGCAVWRMWNNGQDPKSVVAYVSFSMIFWPFVAPFCIVIGATMDFLLFLWQKTFSKFIFLPRVTIVD